MKLFTCSNCGNRLYFENVVCTRCAATLGFLPEAMTLAPLEPAGDGAWRVRDHDQLYRMCVNYAAHSVCNWMVESGGAQAFCLACRLNRTIPDLGVTGNRDRWQTLETEKRRLVYSLLRLGLPVTPLAGDAAGLAFDFLADSGSNFSERGRVKTGHAAGVITINIAEADPVERVRVREQMAEPYRTLLGHFRHESGHYYWDRVIGDSGWLSEWRTQFGDETLDYGQALERYYRNGPPADWCEHFVSAYAAMHPWEDWAETWAHYLHIVDTLETAYQYGLSIRPRAGNEPGVSHDFNPYCQASFETLIDRWLPLTFALNSLNRSMGHDHAYPFVLAPAAIAKLGFVHRVVRETGH